MLEEQEWILVKDINELSPGVRIKVTNCVHCNKTHFRTCLNFHEFTNCKITEDKFGFETIPNDHPEKFIRIFVNQEMCNQERVFKLIDFDANSKEEIAIKESNKTLEKLAYNRANEPVNHKW